MRPDEYNMLRDLAKDNRQMARDIAVLKAQMCRVPFAGKTAYQALSYQTYQAPTIETPTLTNPTLAETITVVNQGTGANSTITSNSSDEQITISNNIEVATGIFAATTITIGDQVLSESDYLVVSDSSTPGIKIADSGDTGNLSTGYLYFVDDADTVIGSLYHASGDVHLTSNLVGNGDLYITAKDDLHIEVNGGNAAITITQDKVVNFADEVKFAASDVNFAGGTTYKVEADGDAFFKDLDCSGNGVIDGTLQLAAGAVITTLGDTAALAASDVKIPTNTTVKEYCDAHLMIGSANAEWIPMPVNALLESAGVHEVIITDDIKCQTGSPSLSFLLVKEYDRGGLNLQISGFRWYQLAADASNFVTRTRVFGLQNDGTVDTLYDDGANQSSTGLKESGSGTLCAFSQDTTGYLSIILYFNTTTATVNLLRMTFPEMECYYS